MAKCSTFLIGYVNKKRTYRKIKLQFLNYRQRELKKKFKGTKFIFK